MLKLEVFALRASLSDSRGKFIVSTQLDCTLHATVHLFLMQGWEFIKEKKKTRKKENKNSYKKIKKVSSFN